MFPTNFGSTRFDSCFRFYKIYFAQSGYKDGLHGLCLLTSMYSLVVFAALGTNEISASNVSLQQLDHELVRNAKIRFWLLTAKIQQTKNFLKIFSITKKLLCI